MTENRVSWALMKTGEIVDPVGLDLPDSEAGNYLATFIDNETGERITTCMTLESANMLAAATVELQAFGSSAAYHRMFREGWPEDWGRPGDLSQWVKQEKP